MRAEIVAVPLNAEAFAPFGEVFEAPTEPRRHYVERALATTRGSAWPSLSVAMREPVLPGPLVARQMERHRFSSQSFVPMSPGRFLVIVAPHAASGGPDMAAARAFIAAPGQGITYGADVWHHPMTVLDTPLAFAIFMWRDGTSGDEEFVDIDPLTIRLS